MAKAKEERNRQFIKDWKTGLSNKELGQKYKLSPGGVKGLKARLRKRDHSLYVEAPISKPAIQQATRPTKQRYGKATYYLDPEMIKDIKRLALENDKDISELVREIFNQYLSKNK